MLFPRLKHIALQPASEEPLGEGGDGDDLDEIKPLQHIQVDRRHNAKVDRRHNAKVNYPALYRMLRRAAYRAM